MKDKKFEHSYNIEFYEILIINVQNLELITIKKKHEQYNT